MSPKPQPLPDPHPYSLKWFQNIDLLETVLNFFQIKIPFESLIKIISSENLKNIMLNNKIKDHRYQKYVAYLDQN